MVPETVAAHPGSLQQELVTARYNDGTTCDVTRLVKFGSVDGSVATVNEDGVVRVTGRGETAISAWYSSKVACSSVVSPYEGSTHAAEPADDSLIDRMVNAKLRELNLNPSPVCSDSDFLRRASLDCTGALPSADDAQKFLVNSAPGKRMELVDRLIASPAYADYWAYKWSDLWRRQQQEPACRIFNQLL